MQVILMAKSSSALQHFDLAGNSLTVTQANLNSLDITIDKNAPSVTNLTLYSNNLNSSLARAGDLINITLEASEQIYNATLQIFGTETSMTESNNTAYTTISVLQNSPNGLAAFNITAYDGAGNEFNITQNDASANVIIDTANPTLSNLTIYSDNAHNTSLATLDDTLNITITTNEDLSSANITILGATYAMSTSGMLANASVTVDASHADGQVEFSITALDLAGNSLTVTQANLNSLDITIDKNAPSVTNLTLYSNNLNSSLARAGDLINITLEVSEQIYNATLQIFDTETSMTESNNTAYTTISVLQNSPNGLAAFNITAYDGAGNEFNITQNDASANVIIDTANPTLSNLTIYSDNAHNTSLATLDDTLNITITTNEDLSSANITILGATYTMSTSGIVANASVTVDASHADGQVEFSITALDLAGNSLTVTQANLNSLDITIDKNAPSVTNLTLYSNNLNSSLARAGDLINITLEVSEQIYNATLQIFGTETSMTESNNTAYTTISVLQNSPNGLAAFNITAYDGAGNEFNITQNDASANVIIDTANPTLSNLTIYSNNAHNTSLATLDDTLNITITANEDLSSANITLLGATYAMSTSGIVANASITVDASHADGQVEFSITALDLAGNSLTVTQANLNSLDITIDKNIPSVTNLTLYSNNLNSSLAKSGDLINITLEVSEQIYNATLQIFDTETSMTESNNTAYTTISVLQNSPNGLAAFNITAYAVLFDSVMLVSVPKICKVAL